MNPIRVALCSLLFLLFLVSPSMAQSQRTFVSGMGSDTNPCSRTAPCRTFAQAVSQTSAGGEVVALDSAGYGAVAIPQSVSITAPPGVYAGISVFSGDGIGIQASTLDTVILRGLTINNQGSAGYGIVCFNVGTLHVESCVVNGFSSAAGVGFLSTGNLEVKDSIIRGNFFGIQVQPPNGMATATIDQVRLERCTDGVLAKQLAKVTVRNSIASANVIGFEAQSDTVSPVELNIENCLASGNSDSGIRAASGSSGVATVRVSNSTVTDNHLGLSNNGFPAVILSRANNTVEGNGTDTKGTIGSYTAK